MQPDELRARLAQFPQLAYVQEPSPLQPLPNFSRQLRGPRFFIKRDDEIGPGLGGNKGRKLAFIMAEALAQGRRKIVTYGGLQSNHARMTAAACAALGLEAHLFFFEKRPPTFQGNLLLDRLFAAQLHFLPLGGGSDGAMTLEMTNRLVRLWAAFRVGPGAYFMPVGGHGVIGCLGYVAAALELHEQIMAAALENVTVVVAAGTGGTLAGLLAGFALLGSPVRVLGIDVGKLWRALPVSLARLAGKLCLALGERYVFEPTAIPLIEKKYAGPAYAVFTQESAQAIRRLAEADGVLLDPVYTGKAFAGVLDLVQKKQFNEEDTVVFVHTGGAPGLWAYESDFR